jgi:hypothetical protein
MNPDRDTTLANLESIWRQARTDLVIDERGLQDVFLWEHSARVARTATLIGSLPGVVAHPLDELALTAAALYHDAGWVVQYREGLLTRSEILGRATSDLQRELAAAMVEERLGHLLHGPSLETAVLSIRRMNDHAVTVPETQVLAEAANLDDIGVLSYWQSVRRCSNEGKGVQVAIDTWQRQKEYHFWEARIADAFRFEVVRELARQRLQKFGEFMDLLAYQHGGRDVAELHGQRGEVVLDRLPIG